MTRHTITTTDYLTALAKTMTENALLNQVRALAHALGWLGYHTHRSDRSEPGYPDLTLVRGGRLIFAELKTEKGKTTEAQKVWLSALEAVEDAAIRHATYVDAESSGGPPEQPLIEVYLWRPTHLLDGTIETILRSPK